MAKDTRRIEDLEDKVTGIRLSKLVYALNNKLLHFEDAPCFIMGYLACEDKTFRRAFDYIRKQLGVSQENVREIELNEEMISLKNYFLENLLAFNSSRREIIMIKVEGFERLKRLQVDWSSLMQDQFRPAHDYDQDVITQQKETYRDLRKKVVVVTHIGYSRGEDGFRKAVTSAETSQFKHFKYEF